jgi:hypothetical protein
LHFSGAEAYHMADAAKQRTKVKYATSAGSGVTVEFEDAVDWVQGDTVWFGMGGDKTVQMFNSAYGALADNWGNEQLVIQTKISPTQYTFNPTFKHMAGDFAVCGARNIRVLSASGTKSVYFRTDNGSDSGKGFTWVYEPYAGASLQFDWVYIRNCGTIRPDSVAYLWDGIFKIRNTLFDGDGSPGAGDTWYGVINFYFGGQPATEEKQFDEIHGYGVYTLFRGTSNASSGGAVTNIGTINIGHITVIAARLSGESALYLSSGPITVDSLWYTASTTIGAVTSALSLDGNVTIKSGHIAFCYNGTWTYTSGYMGRGEIYVENMLITHAWNCACLMYATESRSMLFDSCEFWDIAESGLNVRIGNIEMYDCSFQRCNGTGGRDCGAIGLLTPERSTTCLFKFVNCEFGTLSRNGGANVHISPSHLCDMGGRVVAENCTFVEPFYQTAPTRLGVYKDVIFWSIAPVDSPDDEATYASQGQLCTIELVNPVVKNSSGTDLWSTRYPGVTRYARVGGGGEIHNESTNVIDRRFAIKLLPFTAAFDACGTQAVPLMIPVSTGVPITVKLSFKKNISMPVNRRPKLWMNGPGIYTMVEMSDATNSWEEVTVSGTPTDDGMARVWVTAGINEKRWLVETGDTDNRLSTWVLAGQYYENSDPSIPFRYYWTLTKPAANYIVELYKDSGFGSGNKVATSTGRATVGSITLTTANSSGLSGSVMLDSLGTYINSASRYVDGYSNTFYFGKYLGYAVVYADGLVVT